MIIKHVKKIDMKSAWREHSEIFLFLARVLSIYLLWYMLYHLWILPDGRLDLYLSRNIVAVTSAMLQAVGYDVFAFDRIVAIGYANGLEIIDGCNGIETFGLFVGFVIAYPGNPLKRLIFIPSGILILYLVNVFRIFFLAIIQYHWYPLFHVVHDFTFNLIFYLVVFALWAVWAIYGKEEESNNRVDPKEKELSGVSSETTDAPPQ